MPLAAAFIATFALVYFIQRRRGAIMLDRLHRATLAAMAVSFLIVAVALVIGG